MKRVSGYLDAKRGRIYRAPGQAFCCMKPKAKPCASIAPRCSTGLVMKAFLFPFFKSDLLSLNPSDIWQWPFEFLISGARNEAGSGFLMPFRQIYENLLLEIKQNKTWVLKNSARQHDGLLKITPTMVAHAKSCNHDKSINHGKNIVALLF